MVTTFIQLGKSGITMLNLGLFLFLWSWEPAFGVRVPGSVGVTEVSGVCPLERVELVYRNPQRNRDIKSVLCLSEEQVAISFVGNTETKSFCSSPVSHASLALWSVKLTLHIILVSLAEGSAPL